jgi:uncharacterized protein YydD (DUF2326 family)
VLTWTKNILVLFIMMVCLSLWMIKKENLLAIIRRYAELGLQPIITLIDSDLPVRDAEQPVFSSDEIVITLHDEGEQGRSSK